jgi:hypothetical protein
VISSHDGEAIGPLDPSGGLKEFGRAADKPGTMTVSTITTIDEWAAHPLGKAARVAVAALGLMSAILVLLVATMNGDSAWILVLLGVALAAVSVRAATKPSILRLTTLAAIMVAIPYVGQAF